MFENGDECFMSINAQTISFNTPSSLNNVYIIVYPFLRFTNTAAKNNLSIADCIVRKQNDRYGLLGTRWPIICGTHYDESNEM